MGTVVTNTSHKNEGGDGAVKQNIVFVVNFTYLSCLVCDQLHLLIVLLSTGANKNGWCETVISSSPSLRGGKFDY